MFLNVGIHVETFLCRLSRKLFRGSVKVCWVMDGQPHCEGFSTGREKVGFFVISKGKDTHNLKRNH